MDGTTIVKKVNFQKHVSESVMHQTAALRLKEKEVIQSSVIGGNKPTTSPAASASLSYHGTQTTLIPYVQKMNAHQKSQLCKKFQLAHFVATHGKSFKTYESFTKFEKNIHKVDLGGSYLDDKAGAEITEFFSHSILLKNITEPLNSDTIHYYSVMFDGSSSTKHLDEKELFVMKYCASECPAIIL